MFELLIYPDSRLKNISSEIKVFDEEITNFSTELLNFMKSFKGTVGISAPQVNKFIRLIVVDVSVSSHKKISSNSGSLIICNPEIIENRGEVLVREGCLSVPDFTGNTKRYNYIKVSGQNVFGDNLIVESEGFESVVIQHEIDHLNGKIFIERIISPRDLFKRVRR